MAQQAGFTPTTARRSDGAIAGLRQPLNWSTGRPFRILSIDGGGIKGLFPTSVLTAFERNLLGGRSAGEHFDLITGTSTGGIIALGLALGLPASRILEFYQSHGAKIFPPITGFLAGPRRAWRGLSQISRYTYSRAPLKAALTDVFGDALLGEATRRVCIPAFDGAYGEVHVFKTPHHPDFQRDWKERVVDVAMATAAAPTFFSVFKNQGRLFADGGVWANNPIMIGLVDALSAIDLQRRDVHILSLGCGDLSAPFNTGQVLAGGQWHWRQIIGAAMHLTSQNSLGQAGLLIGRDHLVRIEPDLVDARIKMDDFLAANAVLPVAGEVAAARFLDKVGVFFDTEADQSPAFHGPRAGLVPPNS